MMTTRMLTITAALSFLMVLGHPSTVRADVCGDAFKTWVESERTGRPVTISGTVEAVQNNVGLYTIPVVRGYVVFFKNACGDDFAAEGRGLAPCRVGQSIVVRAIVD